MTADAATDAELGRPAVLVERRVEWSDTDAAGHHHHGAVLRWVESAEAELLRRHGLDWLFGRTPRVHYEVDYHRRLWFGQLVQVELVLTRLGEKSMRFEFEVRSEEGLAASGNVVIAFAEPDAAGASPWPAEVRAALDGAAPGA
jgi:acyl-CoA thioester hydrolase